MSVDAIEEFCVKDAVFDARPWLGWDCRRPVARAAHGAAMYDHRLWIFAGYDGNVRLSDLWSTSLTGDSRAVHVWEEVCVVEFRNITAGNLVISRCEEVTGKRSKIPWTVAGSIDLTIFTLVSTWHLYLQ